MKEVTIAEFLETISENNEYQDTKRTQITKKMSN